MRRNLRGDHCQCAACGAYFNSTAAHAKHRTGDYGKDRRCMTPDEMRAKGMALSSSGWWVTSARENAVSRSYRDARIDREDVVRVSGRVASAIDYTHSGRG